MIGDPVDARTLELNKRWKKIRLGKDPPPGSVTDLADNSTELPAKR